VELAIALPVIAAVAAVLVAPPLARGLRPELVGRR
jgi:hypothetical protein